MRQNCDMQRDCNKYLLSVSCTVSVRQFSWTLATPSRTIRDVPVVNQYLPWDKTTHEDQYRVDMWDEITHEK